MCLDPAHVELAFRHVEYVNIWWTYFFLPTRIESKMETFRP